MGESGTAQKPVVRLAELDADFKDQVRAMPGGEHLLRCYACGTCTAGCPVREIDERYNPRKIIRMVLLGMKKRVLESDFIWMCSTCYSCEERCPQSLPIGERLQKAHDRCAEAT